MKARRGSDAQIVGILPESAWNVCRKHGIAEMMLHRWRATYGGIQQAEVKRLKQLNDDTGG
jgi:putative transposase